MNLGTILLSLLHITTWLARRGMVCIHLPQTFYNTTNPYYVSIKDIPHIPGYFSHRAKHTYNLG